MQNILYTEPKVVNFTFNPLGVWFRCYRDDVMLKLTLPRELLQNREFDSNPTRKVNEAVETALPCNRRRGFCFLHTLNNSCVTVSGRFVSIFTGDVWKCWPCSVTNSPGKNLQGLRAQRVVVISNTLKSVVHHETMLWFHCTHCNPNWGNLQCKGYWCKIFIVGALWPQVLAWQLTKMQLSQMWLKA